MVLSPKINVGDIVSKHVGTLYDARQDPATRGLSWLDGATFFVLPLLVAVPVGWLVYWPKDFLGTATTVVGVIGGLLFNLLVLTLEQARRLQAEVKSMEPAHSARKRHMLESTQELLYNISFEVLVSVGVLAVALVLYLVPNGWALATVVQIAFIWLLGIFVTGLLLVLKRSHHLIVGVID